MGAWRGPGRWAGGAAARMMPAGAWRQDGQLPLRAVPLILMYHGVADVAEDPNKLCVTPGRFAEQMAWLERHRLRGVGIGTLVDAMRAGHAKGDGDAGAGMVGITFDDGYVNVLETALPELQRRGFGATAYIISGRLGATNDWDEGPTWPLMSADQVGKLAAAGIEIGSHSASHVRLAGASAGQLAAEVSASRSALAAVTGTEIRGFAYPCGSMDAEARQAVRDAGYDYACAVEARAADIGLMALPRIYIGQQDGAARMAVKRHIYRSYIAWRGRQT
jgi:peptidoglycan/xylan/chitin deacetylase (PgdA/CDA1 family)